MYCKVLYGLQKIAQIQEQSEKPLRLTRQALNFLMEVQCLADWRADYFSCAILQHQDLAETQEAVENAIAFVSLLNIEQIADLQYALEVLAAVVGEVEE